MHVWIIKETMNHASSHGVRPPLALTLASHLRVSLPNTLPGISTIAMVLSYRANLRGDGQTRSN